VHDAQPQRARPREQPRALRRDVAERRDVVAEQRAEAAGLEEVALHVVALSRNSSSRMSTRL
jgi:hypothetical protein